MPGVPRLARWTWCCLSALRLPALPIGVTPIQVFDSRCSIGDAQKKGIPMGWTWFGWTPGRVTWLQSVAVILKPWGIMHSKKNSVFYL
jgi:hypothetical protein